MGAGAHVTYKGSGEYVEHDYVIRMEGSGMYQCPLNMIQRALNEYKVRGMFKKER